MWDICHAHSLLIISKKSIGNISVMVESIMKFVMMINSINIMFGTLQEQGMGGTVYDRDTIMKKYMNGYDGEHRHQALYPTLRCMLNTAAYCSDASQCLGTDVCLSRVLDSRLPSPWPSTAFTLTVKQLTTLSLQCSHAGRMLLVHTLGFMISSNICVYCKPHVNEIIWPDLMRDSHV